MAGKDDWGGKIKAYIEDMLDLVLKTWILVSQSIDNCSGWFEDWQQGYAAGKEI